MYYSYLPCLILSHDFDEKSDFFNYEFSIRLPAITQFKNGLVQKTQQLDGIIFSKASVDKKHTTNDNIQLSPEGEVNSGGYIPRREASRGDSFLSIYQIK